MKWTLRIGLFVALMGTLVLMALFPTKGSAEVPRMINYQGMLTDPDGVPLTGTFTMRFYLYDALSGGNQLWNPPNGEEQFVSVTDGIYNVQFGSVNPLTDAVFSLDTVYLEVAIYNSDTSAWETLSPRKRITSVAYAFEAKNAQTLEGYGSGDFAPLVHEHAGADITMGTVDEARIDPDIARDSEITWGKLSGIPEDIADGDQVGLTVEADPTVLASVKDGVSWGELSGIPAGFADGVDNNSGGDITAVTTGEGLSGGGSSGAVNLSVANPLSLTNSLHNQGVITAHNNDNLSGYGLYGSASGDYGRGVYGEASATYQAENYGGFFTAAGIRGTGVKGVATYRGVYGIAEGENGKFGGYFRAEGASGRGVYGAALYSGPVANFGGFFYAVGQSGTGVYAEATAETGTNYGVYALSKSMTGYGVYGLAESDEGDTFGVYGESKADMGRGVYGYASHANGNTIGVYGRCDSPFGYGVYGYGYALTGNAYGVQGTSRSSSGSGVDGFASSNTGTTNGVRGTSKSTSGHGVYGLASATTGTTYGVYGESNSSSGHGVYGLATSSSGVTVGVYGRAVSSSGYAGYFNGKVRVTGYLDKPGGGFQIDHPLDPEGKYLNHSFVESPDMKNVYDGTVYLDALGEAWVELAEWFEALNRDFRYQLTAIGAPGPNPFIAEKIANNRFKIAGGQPGMEVSWQVTGIRQDPWGNANRVEVKEEKPEGERGSYLHPEAYGMSIE